MRWFHISVIALFIAATLLFAVQNFEMVTMSFLGFSARAPLALLVAVVLFGRDGDGRQPVGRIAPLRAGIKTSAGAMAARASLSQAQQPGQP